jgi:hypothetical protein
MQVVTYAINIYEQRAARQRQKDKENLRRELVDSAAFKDRVKARSIRSSIP